MWLITCTAVFLLLCAFGVCVDFAWGVSVVSWGIIATKHLAFNCADLIAILPGYWMRHAGVRRHIGRLRYGATLLWTGGLTAALAAPCLGWWLYLIAAALLGQPASLRQMREIVNLTLRSRNAGK